MRPLFVALTLTACRAPGLGGDSAIEITGYLDASRVSFTNRDGAVLAVGAEGATNEGAVVVLENLDSGATAEAVAAELGSFVVSVAALPGAMVELTAVGAPGDQAQHHTVEDRLPFPTPSATYAALDPQEDHLAIVEIGFDPARSNGHVWMVNDTQDHGVVLLDVHEDGALHTGWIPAAVDDWIVLWWVPEGEPESLPLELRVAP